MNNNVKQLLNLAEDCSEQEYLDAVRVRVAEIDGWTKIVKNDDPDAGVWNFRGIHGQRKCSLVIHNYPQDLNAIARVKRDNGLGTKERYSENLCYVTLQQDATDPIYPADTYEVSEATALQRCEALILTMEGAK